MLARARLEKAHCGVLAYRTGSCAASLTLTSNVLVEPERVRYVRLFGNDCLRQLRLCVAPETYAVSIGHLWWRRVASLADYNGWFLQ